MCIRDSPRGPHRPRPAHPRRTPPRPPGPKLTHGCVRRACFLGRSTLSDTRCRAAGWEQPQEVATMLVKEVMTSPAITAPARTTVKEGLRLLDKHGVTSLPVTDNEGRIVGIISEADLLLDALRHDARTRMIPDDSVDDHPNCVGDVMSMLTMTVTGDTDLADAVEL